MVCCYELFAASAAFDPPTEKSPECPTRTREHMFKMWRAMLLDIGFMNEQQAEHMMLGIRRIFSRTPLTTDDVNILMGVARQMEWKSRTATGDPSHEPRPLE